MLQHLILINYIFFHDVLTLWCRQWFNFYLIYKLFNNTINDEWLELTDWVWKKFKNNFSYYNVHDFLRVLRSLIVVVTLALVPMTKFDCNILFNLVQWSLIWYSQDKSDSENELDDTIGPLGRGKFTQSFHTTL